MNILISDTLPDICRELLEEKQIAVTYRPDLSAEELLDTISDFEGLIVRSGTQVTADVIRRGKKLKVVGRAGSGVDNIDVGEATENGVAVLNCVGANTLSAAEHTLALLISLARQIPAAHQSLRQGRWDRAKFKGVELNGKTYGIIGLGKIGVEIARRAQAFDMTTISHDPLIPPEVFKDARVESVSLEDLLNRSDFISIHVPLLPETKHLIGVKELQMCKKSLRLINTSRGGIVDETALYQALSEGRIAGAALDVFEVEPPVDNALLSLENVIATPHLGASTYEAQERVAKGIAERVSRFLLDGTAKDLVNPEVQTST